MEEKRDRYELWVWAPLSRRWYREGASAEGPAGLAILRRIRELAPEGVRLQVRRQTGEIVQD